MADLTCIGHSEVNADYDIRRQPIPNLWGELLAVDHHSLLFIHLDGKWLMANDTFNKDTTGLSSAE